MTGWEKSNVPDDTFYRKTTRRAFLKGLLWGSALSILSVGGGVYYAGTVEPRWLERVALTIPVPGLPHSFDGVTLAHISDLHFGAYVPFEYLRRALISTSAYRPDYILVTGDFIHRTARLNGDIAKALALLRADGGVYGVLGNHDHWFGPDVVEQLASDAGIRILRNASVPLERNGERIWLLGMDDAWQGADDLERTLEGVPENEVRILMAHEPDVADRTMAHGIALQLSGHSHGGQVRLPGIGPLVLPELARKYPAGLYRVGDGFLYTNRGLGMVFPPVRFHCRPEITLITLKSVPVG